MLERLARPDLVLFDWDNTLVDTMPTIFAALNATMRHFDKAEFDLVGVKESMNSPLREHFPKLFGDLWEDARDVYYGFYDEYVEDNLASKGEAESCLRDLHGHDIPLGVVSNKRGNLLRIEIDLLRWKRYFKGAVGAGDAVADKPSVEVYGKFLSQSKLSAEELDVVWMVGDSDVDMKFASNIGARGFLLNDRFASGPNYYQINYLSRLLEVDCLR